MYQYTLEPAEPVMVTVLWMDTYLMGDDELQAYVSVALVLPEGTKAPCLHVVDPEDVSTFQACLDAPAETFVGSGELFPYRWYQQLFERTQGPALALERVE